MALALPIACASPGATKTPQQSPAPSGEQRMRDASLGAQDDIPVATRMAIVNRIWEDRTAIVADDAFISRRSLYLLTGTLPDSSMTWTPAIRDVMWGDTLPHQQQPAAPNALRIWSISDLASRESNEMSATGRVSYGPREHLERYVLRYRDGRWVLVRITIDTFVYY